MDLTPYHGKTGQCTFDKITVPIVILNSRSLFGRLEFLIQAINGQHSVWVSTARIQFDDGTKTLYGA